MKIKNHKLYHDDGKPTPFTRSPNQSWNFTPKYLVMHYTAGPSLERAVQTLTSKKRKASAHVVIGRDGKIHQLVSFNKKAWHAGKSAWKDLFGMNAHSFGIELVNSGPLKRNQAGQWKTWYGKIVPNDEVEIFQGKNGKITGWHDYPEAQMNAAMEVAEVLFDKYKLLDVLAHSDIAPKRKRDTGPAFDMPSFRSSLISRDNEEADWQDDDDGVPDFIYYNPNTQEYEKP